MEEKTESEILAEEKALRKKKRREKRKQANERILHMIQTATHPQQLFDCLLEIEKAIPTGWALDLDNNPLPQCAPTCAAFALRLFTLDRAIRYDEIPGVEAISQRLQYKPRVNFVCKCFVASSCRYVLGHPGRCVLVNDPISRCPEIIEGQPSYFGPAYVSSNVSRPSIGGGPVGDYMRRQSNTGMQSQYNHNNNSFSLQQQLLYQQQLVRQHQNQQYSYANQYKYRYRDGDEDEEEDEFEPMRRKKERRLDFDIECLQPYVPSLQEITESDWI